MVCPRRENGVCRAAVEAVLLFVRVAAAAEDGSLAGWRGSNTGLKVKRRVRSSLAASGHLIECCDVRQSAMRKLKVKLKGLTRTGFVHGSGLRSKEPAQVHNRTLAGRFDTESDRTEQRYYLRPLRRTVTSMISEAAVPGAPKPCNDVSGLLLCSLYLLAFDAAVITDWTVLAWSYVPICLPLLQAEQFSNKTLTEKHLLTTFAAMAVR